MLFSLAFIVLFAVLGYLFILFGGRLVVDEKQLLLDATTTIETADGTVVHELYNERRYPVTLNQVPEHVKQAFVAVEDVRFYQHAGVDFKSVLRAVYRDVIAMNKVEGASTITQQLSKNLFLQNDKTWMRKTKEVMAAIYLERNYTKEEILELYLNKVYFGHGVHGIEAASRKFFSKSVEELTIAESALLAGIVKSPSGYSPIDQAENALTRRNVVLASMNNAGMINHETLKMEQGKTLGLNLEEKPNQTFAASYIDLAIDEAASKYQLSLNELKRGGYRIIIHMDELIQKTAYEEFQNDVYFPGNTEGVEGSFVMMDVERGNVVAAIGGRDYQYGDLNRVLVKRQPGSTMKPIAVYAPAMMQENYTPYTILRDDPQNYGDYVASNVDGQYDGMVTVYDAVVKSKNAPAVWLLNEIGISHAKSYLQKLGINIPDEGLAIALGGLSEGVTPMDMMKSYRSFAHRGQMIEPNVIKEIINQRGNVVFEEKKLTAEVFNAQVAWNMTSILLHTVETGTAKAGNYRKELAGKTGSTQHPFVSGMTKDAWFVGYTPEYVSALWMGYDVSDKDHYLTGGSSYPTELTKKILSEVDAKRPLQEKFIKPDTVIDLPKPIQLPEIKDVEIHYSFGIFPFIKGNITWNVDHADERVVYRIYRETEGIDERIGEVVGENSFTIDDISIFESEKFYVVPYDSNTKIEGNPSKVVILSVK